MSVIKQITFAGLFLLGTLPAFAQKHHEAEYLFRFVPGRDIFYVPYKGNGIRLDSLVTEISTYMAPLQNRDCYISVSSYGADSGQSEKLARVRRLRVKSELIERCAVTEDMFVTDRHIPTPYKDSLNNVVVVILPAPADRVEAIAGQEAAERVRNYNLPPVEEEKEDVTTGTDTVVVRSEPVVADTVVRQEPNLVVSASEAVQIPSKNWDCSFSVCANLLRWATLTPDLGIEWRINRQVGIAVNGSWTSWSWNGKDRRYALWEVVPEVRYYIGKEKRGYIGAMYKVCEFNYKFSETGKQGDLMGGGITGGYQLKLNKALSMDFSLGLGCIHADYEKYLVIDGVRVRQGKESKNWWGPTSAGVTLVWTIF